MELFKIKKILIPVDFSFASLKAIDPAVQLAKLTKAEITLVHIIDILRTTAPPFYFTIPGNPVFESDLTDVAKQQLNKLAQSIKKRGVEKVNVSAISGRIYEKIVRLSKRLQTDIIIMGTHGISGFSEFFMGSNTFRVVSHAACPVLSVQQHIKDSHFKNIIVPFRDKPHSREKIDYAISMAKIYGATLHVLGVDTEGTPSHQNKMILEGEQIKRIIEEFEIKCKLKVITDSYVADSLLKYAKKINAGLIIVTADMDKISISEFFMGPFAQQIVNHSPIPVLSIRPTFNTDTIDLRFY